MGNDVTLMDKWYRKDTNKVRTKHLKYNYKSSSSSYRYSLRLQCSAAVWSVVFYQDHLITGLWQTWQGELAFGMPTLRKKEEREGGGSSCLIWENTIQRRKPCNEFVSGATWVNPSSHHDSPCSLSQQKAAKAPGRMHHLRPYLQRSWNSWPWVSPQWHSHLGSRCRHLVGNPWQDAANVEKSCQGAPRRISKEKR